MLYGWASQKEKYPLQLVTTAVQAGYQHLFDRNEVWKIVGEGGSSFALAVKTLGLESSPLGNLSASEIGPSELYGKLKIEKESDGSWLTVRGRLTSPIHIADVVGDLGVGNIVASSIMLSMTARSEKLHPYLTDETAPLEIKSAGVGSVIGLITNLIAETANLNLKVSERDGRTILNYLLSDSAKIMEKLEYFSSLPYALHWVIMNNLGTKVHIMRSLEPDGFVRTDPVLFTGQNKKGTIVFARHAEMISGEFSADLTAPNPGTVYTINT